MKITGELLIGNQTRMGENGTLTAVEAATGKALSGAFGGASAADLDEAVRLAWQAFFAYRETTLEDRAAFLEKAAANILAIGDPLIERAMAESGLPRARLEGERMRTVNQLRLFAGVVREGAFQIPPMPRVRRPSPISGCARSASARLPSSAHRIFRWRFRWPAAIPPRRWRPDARWWSRPIRPIPAPRNWWPAPCSRP